MAPAGRLFGSKPLGQAIRNSKVELPGGVDIGLAHIVAVTDPADALAGDAAAVLDPGLDVRQQLAGVVIVGQAVDDRYAGLGRERSTISWPKVRIITRSTIEEITRALSSIGSPAQLGVVGDRNMA